MSKSGLSWSNQEALLCQLWLISQNVDLKDYRTTAFSGRLTTWLFVSLKVQGRLTISGMVSYHDGLWTFSIHNWWCGVNQTHRVISLGFHYWRNWTSYTLFISHPHLCLWSHRLIRLPCSYPILPGGIQNYSTNCSACLQDVICLSVSD